ncbi:MAG: hypothetical protein HQL94_09755 [Magnetococcales bacterium]|nr:hypothetical protein [Magnetococcales bacterium]MBF0439174.1 hypothetical protein [Magnetococcales bacterium]
MGKEKRCFPDSCDSIANEISMRLDYLYKRHAALVGRMDDVERVTRERLEQLGDLATQQQTLLRMAKEQEEESNRIFANQNELLHSLHDTLGDIHERLRQLSERQDALMRRVAVTTVSK